jgi:nuclear pore complex protein Nup50
LIPTGNLFIKPLAGDDEGEKSKHSLLVRADTNLGNILLNISINSLKFTALGNKDISFLCIPNPLPDPKMSPDTPVVMLLRVKDAEIRDEVLEQLTSHS